jgi:hypothetical protein
VQENFPEKLPDEKDNIISLDEFKRRRVTYVEIEGRLFEANAYGQIIREVSPPDAPDALGGSGA